MVRDEDFQKHHLFCPVQRYPALAKDMTPISAGDLRTVLAAIDQSPPVWNARLVSEDLWDAGNTHITEDLVHRVLTAWTPETCH